jgi:type IV pilus assembly protein PilB
MEEILLQSNLVRREDIEEAEAIRSSSGGELKDILVSLGKVSSRDVVGAVAQQLGIPFVDLTRDTVRPDALPLVPPRRCRALEALPIWFKDQSTLCVAMADPTDLGKVDDLRFITGLRVEPYLADRDALLAVMGELFPESVEIESQLQEIQGISLEIEEPTEDEGPMDITEMEAYEEAPVVALLNLILKQAILGRASDIHLEPKENYTRVRLRVDGVLQEKAPLPLRYRTAVGARVKVLSGMDIAERRMPQDGSFTVGLEGRRVDFRVSAFPTAYGEKVVLRILDASSLKMAFDDMGFPEEVASGIREFMDLHDGIFLVTGPTGSGKSTTLYTLLGEMDSPERNIVTLEDPVEYQMPGLTQGQANEKIGFTFAKGLRSILRQDPDVILVGEVRDLETARISVKSALTGHLVFSTLHTNTACEAVMRLQDMGVEPFLLSAALRGALAQRLARRLCKECKEPYEPGKELLVRHGIEPEPGLQFFRPVGCRACDNLGYKGRMGLYELFRMTEDAQRLVAQGAEPHSLVDVAVMNGYRTLRQDGFDKVKRGLTSLEEILRVT